LIPLSRVAEFKTHKITLGILKQAKELSIPSLWLQPGTTDDEVIRWIEENQMEDRVVYGGPCVLVLGDGIRSNL